MTQVEDYVDFATAISTIGSTVTTLWINSSQTVSANVTVPATLTLKFIGAGQLSIASGKTVTVYAPENILAGDRQQIVSGSGTLAFTTGGTAYAGWWGALGDGSNDDTTAIEAALFSGAGRCLLPSGTYKITATLGHESGTRLFPS